MKINLKGVVSDIAKQMFYRSNSEVQEISADKRAEGARQRQMYNYKALLNLWTVIMV